MLQRYLGGTMGTVYDWNVTTLPQTFLGSANAVQNLTLGKVLGGSSVLNGLMCALLSSWCVRGSQGGEREQVRPAQPSRHRCVGRARQSRVGLAPAAAVLHQGLFYPPTVRSAAAAGVVLMVNGEWRVNGRGGTTKQ